MYATLQSMSTLPVPDQMALVLSTFKRFAQRESSNERRVDYLQMRYMGFTRDESRLHVKVTRNTISRWRSDDDFSYLDDQAVAAHKDIRDQIVEFKWFRNMYLLMTKDEQILMKANGMLEETYLDHDESGRIVEKYGSPPMDKEDWDYFNKMRAMYSLQQWSVVQKQFKEENPSFNITNYIMNRNVQVNNHDS